MASALRRGVVVSAGQAGAAPALLAELVLRPFQEPSCPSVADSESKAPRLPGTSTPHPRGRWDGAKFVYRCTYDRFKP